MIPRSIWRWMILDIRRRIKVKRFWIFGILLGICVTATSLYYFFQAEKKEAENRMVKTVNYVKVQCSTYTHYMKLRNLKVSSAPLKVPDR